MDVQEKLAILADAAKYDTSCASSGSKKTRAGSQIGSTEGMGICHSYTHLKTIPNASDELIAEAGGWADRLSVNIELPTEGDLYQLAPEKKKPQIIDAMSGIRDKIDDNVHSLYQMQKAVTRDVHKMKAFVRFRKTEIRSSEDQVPQENFVAWHRPDHRIVRLAAPFFASRFKGMNWTILTPDESVTWDQSELCYGPGVPVMALASPSPRHPTVMLWKNSGKPTTRRSLIPHASKSP